MMMYCRKLIWVWLIFFTCSSMGWAAYNKSEVKVRAYSRVAGRVTYLQDIADIVCQKETCERLKTIQIMRSPKPGKKRRLSGSMLESKIKSADPLWRNHVTVSMPDIVFVEREYVEIPESEITKVFYAFLEKKAGERSFRVRDVTVRGNRKIALGTVTYAVDDRNLKDIEGRVSVTVIAKVSRERNRTLYVSGWVDVFDQVVCTQRDISRGQVIKKNDLVVKQKNLSRMPDGILFDPDKAQGNVAKTHISAGDCIRTSMVAPAPLVRKGDVVKIIAKSGLLTVVTSGISQEDGHLGEQIGVENSRSKKKITGRVVKKNTIQVLF